MIHECGSERRRPSLAACNTTDPIEYAIPCTMMVISMPRPITLFINSAGGNVTDGLAIHDAVRHIISRGIEITIIVQGMAYSMGSVVLQAASDGRRLAFPHSWIMIHEPAKWAGWQSTSAAAQHLERLKQMQDQIYKILSSRSGKPLRQIIRDTKRTDFYLDAQNALEYGLIDAVVAGELPEPKPVAGDAKDATAAAVDAPQAREAEAARERSNGDRAAATPPADAGASGAVRNV